MTVLAPTDLLDELPGLDFNAPLETGNTLTAVQVQKYLNEVEAQVKSAVATAGFLWPEDGSDAMTALVPTLKLGGIARVLSAIYWDQTPDTTPPSVARAAKDYADALKGLPDLLAGLMAEEPTVYDPGAPVAVMHRDAPRNWQSLEEFTHRRDPVARREAGRWPLL